MQMDWRAMPKKRKNNKESLAVIIFQYNNENDDKIKHMRHNQNLQRINKGVKENKCFHTGSKPSTIKKRPVPHHSMLSHPLPSRMSWQLLSRPIDEALGISWRKRGVVGRQETRFQQMRRHRISSEIRK